MRHIPIFGKISSILAVFGVFVIFTAFYSTEEMRGINTGYIKLKNGPTDALQLITKADVDVELVQAHVAQLMIAATPAAERRELASIAGYRSRFNQFIDGATSDDPAEQAELSSVKTMLSQVVDDDCGEAINLASHAASSADALSDQALYTQQCETHFRELRTAILAVNGHIASAESAGVSSLTSATSRTIQWTFAAILGGLIVIALVAFFGIRSWITLPVKGLQGVMDRLSSGDLQARVTGTDRKDEIGGMARAVQVFKEAGLEKQRLEGEAAAQRQAAEQERQRADAERAAAAKQQEFVVHSVAEGLEKLSNGDLLFRLTTAFGGDYEKLRAD
ncbi:MAG TPA: HAMP domain-containing protein, partial [Acidocella sp.]|nr:HAMP domain-containing protein [Acidocella sp.]